MIGAVEPERLAPLTDLAHRLLPGSGAVAITRPESGGSTPVYRIVRGGLTQYVRLAEQPGLSLDPERFVHTRLRELGARVPDIVHFERRHSELGRSVLVITKISGGPASDSGPGSIWRAAGRDVATIASLPVDGFGWVRRDLPEGAPLAAEHATLRAFALVPVPEQCAAVFGLLGAALTDAITRAVERYAPLIDEPDAWLAHGDFDASHIFRSNDAYAGVIDFGEIRGAGRFYDLGHFALHEGARLPGALAQLLQGYADVAPLPDDVLLRINLWSVLIGVGRLALIRDRPADAYRRTLLTGVRSALTELQNG